MERVRGGVKWGRGVHLCLLHHGLDLELLLERGGVVQHLEAELVIVGLHDVLHTVENAGDALRLNTPYTTVS